jgi:phosphoglycolate phosphatase
MAAIIFDFDGTIADSFDYVAGFLATEAGLSSLSVDQKRDLRGLSMVAMARRLGHGWWRLPWLLFKGRRQMGDVINQLQAFSGIAAIIEKLHAEGHELFIVSSNSVRNVRTFLRHHKLQTYFLEVYGGVGMFNKAPALRRLLKEHHLKADESVYIGDELRDVEAAQSIKLPVIAVTWGFARRSDLADKTPLALATTPADLIRILEDR